MASRLPWVINLDSGHPYAPKRIEAFLFSLTPGSGLARILSQLINSLDLVNV